MIIFLNFCILDLKVYGEATNNFIFYQISHHMGEVECAFEDDVTSHYSQFNGATSYHQGYAQCSSWRKEDINRIRISMNGNEYFTDVHSAIKAGPHPYTNQQGRHSHLGIDNCFESMILFTKILM